MLQQKPNFGCDLQQHRWPSHAQSLSFIYIIRNQQFLLLILISSLTVSNFRTLWDKNGILQILTKENPISCNKNRTLAAIAATQNTNKSGRGPTAFDLKVNTDGPPKLSHENGKIRKNNFFRNSKQKRGQKQHLVIVMLNCLENCIEKPRGWVKTWHAYLTLLVLGGSLNPTSTRKAGM